MGLPPSQASKVAAGLGVLTFICAIVANASTSNILQSTTIDVLGVPTDVENEIGIWQTKTTIGGVSVTDSTECEPDNGCGDNECCASTSSRCKSLMAFAVLGTSRVPT